jgi:hypothetical protein
MYLIKNKSIVKIITDKPNNVEKKLFDLERRKSDVSTEIHEKIKYYFDVPNQKYFNPLTSSQEIGWEKFDGLNYHFRNHPKYRCDVTDYANEYFALKGRSPFASKDPMNKRGAITKDNKG